ncbi:hypothetical protein ACFQ1S_00210 [Kibdelosporangium lantanae]|uniref:Tyr recombinase domain-containing protein n=1 Tax=Kibdelosporangium lantanae TaxID=1497396 RepID=A0ABW3M2D5_9PSEU
MTKLPSIPSKQQWLDLLEILRDESVHNRVMFALAYDAALRREELCALRTDDPRFCSSDAGGTGGDGEDPV